MKAASNIIPQKEIEALVEVFERIRPECMPNSLSGTLEINETNHLYPGVGKPEYFIDDWLKTVTLAASGVRHYRKEQTSNSNDAMKALVANDEFATATESDLVLLKKFVKKRDDIMSQFEFFSAKEFCSFTGFIDKNQSRLLSKKKSICEILAVIKGSSEYYPAFQLNNKAHVYPEIIDLLKRIQDTAMDEWDVCFFLTEPKMLVLKQFEASDALLKGKTLSQVIIITNQISDMSEVYNGSPIDALKIGKIEVFKAFVDDWLNQEQRKVPTKLISKLPACKE